MTFPDDHSEFDRCWSGAAGELAGIKYAIAEAEKRAGECFVRKRDEPANALRDLATALGARRDELSKAVDGYIAESRKRAYEVRKMCGGR